MLFFAGMHFSVNEKSFLGLFLSPTGNFKTQDLNDTAVDNDIAVDNVDNDVAVHDVDNDDVDNVDHEVRRRFDLFWITGLHFLVQQSRKRKY